MNPNIFELCILSLFCVLFLGEMIARHLHLADYILYTRSHEFGFMPQPNSSGVLRRRYRWRINSDGLRSDQCRPVLQEGILLVGDSIVEGGATTDQSDTLSHHLASQTDRPIYPIAASGWTLGNELAFLQHNPAFLVAGTCVIITNSEDLDTVNHWSNEATHPTTAPQFQLLYLIKRVGWALWYRLNEPTSSHSHEALVLPGDRADWQVSVKDFLSSFQGRLIWVLYPSRLERASAVRPAEGLRSLIEGSVSVVDLISYHDWTDACYRDRMHPNTHGRQVLSEVLARLLRP